MLEIFRDDPVGYLKAVKGEDALRKFDQKYQRKASRRADIALNGILHTSRCTRREWELLPIESTRGYQYLKNNDTPTWYRFYQVGYRAGVVAVTNVTEQSEVLTVAAVDQLWGPGGVGGTFFVPQTRIAVIRQEVEPPLDLPIVSADGVKNTFQQVYDYESYRRAISD